MDLSFRCIFLTLLALTLISSAALAGNTGKLSGRVTDASTGEPLIGVNILIVGTTRGAITDLSGRYAIIGIPAGTYTVRASLIGYQIIEVRNFEIVADQTKSLNFRLAATAIQMESVVVTAEAPLVNVQNTSSEQTVTAKTIEQIPNVKTIQDVMTIQPGVVRMGNNLFLRGGRANEIQYLVDGVPVNDILGGSSGLLATASVNEQLQQLYAGVQSGYIGGGATGLAVSANAVQSLTVTSSGFDAEYGNAQSGVINIITKSGSEKYVGAMQYRTDRFASSNSFNESYISFNIGGPEPITSYLLPMAGIKIPGSMTFFVNTDFNQNDGPYNYEQNEFFNPLYRKVQFGGFLGDLLSGLGFKYRDYLNNGFTFDLKLKYDLTGTDQLTYGYRTSLGSSHGYNHFWRYRADSSQTSSRISTQNILQWTRFLGTNSFFRLYLGKLINQSGNDIAGLTPPYYSYATSQTDPNGDGFGELGTDQDWLDAKSTVWTVKFDFNSQVHPVHLLKAGFEFNYEEIRSTEIQFPTALNRSTDPNARGEYPGYGLYRWVLDNYPNRGSFYVQDNIEYQGLNLHLGIRYDYLYPGKQIFYQDYIDQWELATNLKAAWPSNKTGNSALLWYLTHGWFSPRLSIGYPITERIVFYFNYGHFYQFPSRDQYFRDPFTLQPGGWVGNPDLRPQKTIQYEAGFDDQFTDDMAFSIRGFYKDIFDYSTLAPAGPPGLLTYLYVNLDYASARGFEITLNKTFTHHISGSFNYSYQIAKGRSASPFAAVYQPQFQLPRETRLDWDQNHTVNLFLSYRVGPREEFELFGLPFINNWGFSLTWNYGSGFPFTPYNTGRSLASAYLKNTGNGPYSSNVNLTFYKGFLLFDHLNIMITFDITNLFNRRNPTTDAYVFNNFTGNTYEYGDYDPNTQLIYQWYQMEGSFFRPYRFGNPRQFLLGVKLNWE